MVAATPSTAPSSTASLAVAATASRDRGLGPFGVAVAGRRDRAHERGRVLDHLALHGLRDVPTAPGHRRRRADVRARRHDRDVGRQGNERSGARCVGAGRRHPGDRRHPCGEQRLHDPAGLREVATRRVDGEDHSDGAITLRLRQPFLDVRGEDRVDHPGDRHDRHGRAAVHSPGGGAGKDQHDPERERDREHDAADAIHAREDRDLRPPYRTPASSRNLNVSRLHVSSPSATAATSSGAAKAPVSLVVSRTATGRPAASAT